MYVLREKSTAVGALPVQLFKGHRPYEQAYERHGVLPFSHRH